MCINKLFGINTTIAVLSIILLLAHLFQESIGGGCRRLFFNTVVSGKALTNHTLRTVEQVTSKRTCSRECYLEPFCHSYNYCQKPNQSPVCELSKSDHVRHLDNMTEMAGCTYHGTQNHCSSNPCTKNATCSGDYLQEAVPYKCICPAGYEGRNCDHDVDECAKGMHDCHVNAICNNIVGGFNCSCKSGYHGNGQQCEDIDECANGKHDCHVNATCKNTVGGFDCACKCGYHGNGQQCEVAKNCAELRTPCKKASGVYRIYPDGQGAFKVYCDQTTRGGGWTVFQRRKDGSVDFYRGWDEYKRGFGNLTGEFWLGLDKIHRLTAQANNRVRIDLEDWEGNSMFDEYDSFKVSNEAGKYKLGLGKHSGTAGNSFSTHRGMAFTTKDRDNDKYHVNCAQKYKGAWWYNQCHTANLNGLYHHGGKILSFADGISYKSWKGPYYSAKRAEMKMRPV